MQKYERIANFDRSPRYLLTKEKTCDFEQSDSTEELWKRHDKLIVERKFLSHASTSGNLLKLKRELSDRILTNCILCERRCGVNRAKGEKGICGVLDSRISSNFIHMGEEPEVTPSYTIFFSGCTFRCVFCQNWDISTDPGNGMEISPELLAAMIEDVDPSIGFESNRVKSISNSFSKRRSRYAKNVNWVGGEPTSNIPYILRTLEVCKSKLPQIWNSNMYLTIESMKLLDGVIDLYLSDFKYGNDSCAKRLSGVEGYFKIVSRNHLLAAEQCDLLIRHLVMPNHIECCTRPILEWISTHLPHAVINVMSQYRPEHRAHQFEDISMPISSREYSRAIKIAEDLGLNLTT